MECECRRDEPVAREDQIIFFDAKGQPYWWARKSCPVHGMRVIDPAPVPEPAT